jgi:integrase
MTAHLWGHLGKLLLLTGQRVGEVVGMTDREFGGDLRHLAGERTKNGRAYNVPLSQATQMALDDVERIKGDAVLIMTTNGKTPLSGFHKGRNRLADRMTEWHLRKWGRRSRYCIGLFTTCAAHLQPVWHGLA